MKKSNDFEEKYIRLNGHRVKAIVPKKMITLEEGVRRSVRILRKYVSQAS